ncbi:MAG: SH3 domain-containing protein [Nitrospirales bacterium]|nr:SH3 domain-containing protein [Nitrospira sp.]MDR4501965.1 SH3 domain-containing protein [Nitrospirales bacterium]
MMIGNAHVLASVEHPHPAWPIFLAQEPEQDLEFDEGLEEDELNQHKPPTRRPLLWILLLLIAFGLVYWTMKPDLAQFTGLPGSSDSMEASPSSQPEARISHQVPSTHSVPTPKFGEGETVTLSPSSSPSLASLTLTADAAGRQPGPRIRIGDSLLILDGQAIDDHWIYEIRTPSGKRGWVSEKYLQSKT